MNRRCSILLALILALATGAGLAAWTDRAGLSQWLEGPVRRSGQFGIVWGDPGPGLEPSRMVYTLTTSTSEVLHLQIADEVAAQAGGVLALDRRQVTIEGSLLAPAGWQVGGIAVIDVSAIALVDPDRAADVTVSHVTGPNPWVSIMCKFADVAAEPKDAAFFLGMYSSTKPGLDHYWREQSFDLANVSGSAVAGWVTLPQPRSYYVYDQNGDGVAELDLTRALQDCTAAADPYVYFPTFVGINMMFNDVLDCCAWGGGRTLTLDGITKRWNLTWEPPWAYRDISVIEHEMGHGFGLPHSSGNYGLTYDNPWDVMSWDRVNRAASTDPIYGCLGQHTIAYHKDRLGWLDGRQVDVPIGTETTVSLDHLAVASAAPQWAKVPIGATNRFYTVEARERVGYDIKLPGDAVIIHEVDPSRGIPAHIYDKDGNGNNNDAGTMWTPGQTFVDAVNHITVQVNAATSTGFDVTISNDVTQLGAPTGLTATALGSTVTLRWLAPATGGAPLAYWIEAGTAPGLSDLANFSTGNALTAYSAYGVANGLYFLRVRAAHVGGTSGPSNEVQLLVGPALPDAPTGLSASAVGSTVTLSWSAAAGGGTPTAYRIEAGSATGLLDLANVSTATATTSYSTGGVSNGTYYIRVRATNSVGTSPASNEAILVVGPAAPGAPSALNWSSAGSSISLTWTAPTTGGLPTAYFIEAGTSPGAANLANFSTGSPATSYWSGGIGNGTYFVRVKGTNTGGTSGPSNEVALVVGCTAAPGAPISLHTDTNVGGTVQFGWTAPNVAGTSNGPTTYVFEAGSAAGLSDLAVVDIGGPATTATFGGIGAGTYYVRVKARNLCGTGGASNQFTLIVP